MKDLNYLKRYKEGRKDLPELSYHIARTESHMMQSTRHYIESASPPVSDWSKCVAHRPLTKRFVCRDVSRFGLLEIVSLRLYTISATAMMNHQTEDLFQYLPRQSERIFDTCTILGDGTGLYST